MWVPANSHSPRVLSQSHLSDDSEEGCRLNTDLLEFALQLRKTTENLS